MASLTAYPDPGIGATTADGSLADDCGDGSCGRTWAAMQASPGDTVRMTDTADIAVTIYRNAAGALGGPDWRYIYRGGWTFDTSGAGGGAVSATDFDLYNTNVSGAASPTPSYNIYSFGPAADNSFTGTDWATTGTTALSTQVAHGSMTTGSYQTWVLNATGIAQVNPSGITKLSMRESDYDVTGTEPGFLVLGVWVRVDVRWADFTGTASDPRLTVTFSTTPSANVCKFF